jgi:adenylosuccinate lyase
MDDVFKNIKVFPENMKKNLEITGGLPMAESLMTVLIGKSVGRGDAHEIMRKTSLKAAKEGKTLKEVFTQENKKLKLLSDKEINHALDPKNYLGATDKIIDRVVKKLER